MNHIGVVKSLFDAHLLPRIISGASAGSIVAAVLCTRIDDEIPQFLLDFCQGDLQVFEREGEEDSVLQKAFRFLTKGALFDISNLVRVMRNILGDMTFQEAYNRTRRILNICVSTASLYELPRLLNYVTAPNVMIWSAVATSCSVPFVFSPAQLLAKDPRTGKEVPWDSSPQRWIDGSVDNDLPMTRLAEMFNVNHFIVSQVNPHVVPFLEKDENAIAASSNKTKTTFAVGPSWLRSMAELARDEAIHRMHVLAELGIMPTTMSKVRSILSQHYSGDITILPEVSYAQFPNVLRNPSTDFVMGAMLTGERATWPKLSQVRNHCALEIALDDAVQRVRTRLVFSKSQIDMRLNAMSKPDMLNLAGHGKRRQKRRASHDSPDGNTVLAVPKSVRAHSVFVPNGSGLKVAGPENESGSSGMDTASSSAAEEFDLGEETLSSSSMDSPPMQGTFWPTHLSSSVSQPTTPGGGITFRAFSFSPLTSSAATLREPHEATEGRRQSFVGYNTGDMPTIQFPATKVEGDVYDTRKARRHMRSLSTGLKGLWPPKRQ